MGLSMQLTTTIPASQEGSFNGVLIRLFRKHVSSISNQEPDGCDFIIWGYYDWIKFETGKKSLHDFYIDNELTLVNYPDYEEQVLCVYSHNAENDLFDGGKFLDKPIIVVSEIKI